MNTAPRSGSSQLPNPEIYGEFLAAYSRHQGRVQAFIRALVPDATQADDVFQASVLVLWRSFSTFDRSREFLPWAIGVARHQVLGHWRTRRRDRHVFNDDLLANLADQAAGMVTGVDARQRALDRCVESLSDRQRDLGLCERWQEGWRPGIGSGRSLHQSDNAAVAGAD